MMKFEMNTQKYSRVVKWGERSNQRIKFVACIIIWPLSLRKSFFNSISLRLPLGLRTIRGVSEGSCPVRLLPEKPKMIIFACL